MTTFPNQKIVKINKGKGSPTWTQENKLPYFVAQRVLSKTAFSIYLYLVTNSNGYECALSMQDITAVLGMSDSAYWKAVNELKKEGYLVSFGGNKFNFYEDRNVLIN